MHRDTVQNSDFYNENPDTCHSTVSNTRVLKYHWKGFNDSQKSNVLLEQERMRQDRIAADNLEKEKERLFAEQEEKVRRDLVKMQREHARQRDNVAVDTVQFNKYKAMEDQQRSKILYDDVHTFKI